MATPVFKGSGEITSLSRADGYVEIEVGVEDIAAGPSVVVTLYWRSGAGLGAQRGFRCPRLRQRPLSRVSYLPRRALTASQLTTFHQAAR